MKTCCKTGDEKAQIQVINATIKKWGSRIA